MQRWPVLIFTVLVLVIFVVICNWLFTSCGGRYYTHALVCFSVVRFSTQSCILFSVCKLDSLKPGHRGQMTVSSRHPLKRGYHMNCKSLVDPIMPDTFN